MIWVKTLKLNAIGDFSNNTWRNFSLLNISYLSQISLDSSFEESPTLLLLNGCIAMDWTTTDREWAVGYHIILYHIFRSSIAPGNHWYELISRRQVHMKNLRFYLGARTEPLQIKSERVQPPASVSSTSIARSIIVLIFSQTQTFKTNSMKIMGKHSRALHVN